MPLCVCAVHNVKQEWLVLYQIVVLNHRIPSEDRHSWTSLVFNEGYLSQRSLLKFRKWLHLDQEGPRYM
jgi:hypothetical protein